MCAFRLRPRPSPGTPRPRRLLATLPRCGGHDAAVAQLRAPRSSSSRRRATRRGWVHAAPVAAMSLHRRGRAARRCARLPGQLESLSSPPRVGGLRRTLAAVDRPRPGVPVPGCVGNGYLRDARAVTALLSTVWAPPAGEDEDARARVRAESCGSASPRSARLPRCLPRRCAATGVSSAQYAIHQAGTLDARRRDGLGRDAPALASAPTLAAKDSGGSWYVCRRACRSTG
jgi:hypothetical protein